MKFIGTFLSLLLVLDLALPVLAAENSKAKNTAVTAKSSAQDTGQKKGKFKQRKAVISKSAKTDNPYSVSHPYNPDNPPPINNKVHPVSSNAH